MESRYACRNCTTLEPAGTKFRLWSACKAARYCSTYCQIAHWPSHKVFTYPSNPKKVECAELRERRSAIDPKLERKFVRWRASKLEHTSNLVMSLMHPISKLRIESHISSIRLKELPTGFRVIAAESINIESLPAENVVSIREALTSRQKVDPKGI
jgi:hypothetical protein